MKSSQISYYLRSIIVFLGTIMLLSCKNDIKQVEALAEEQDKPEMVGYELELIYSDSARIKYKVLTPEYVKTTQGVEKYEAPVVPTPVMPELDLGLANPAYAKPSTGTAPTLQTPKAPTSQVKEQSIKIPTFLKK
jgi:hypothetical protein